MHSLCVHGIGDYFKLIYCVYVCPSIRGQLWSQRSPSTFTWAPRVELRSPTCTANTFTSLAQSFSLHVIKKRIYLENLGEPQTPDPYVSTSPVLEFWHLPILRQVSIRTISSSFHKSVPGVDGARVGLSSLS